MGVVVRRGAVWGWVAGGVFAGLLSSCAGEISSTGGGPSAGAARTRAAGGGTNAAGANPLDPMPPAGRGAGGGPSSVADAGARAAPILPAPSTRAARLTHIQWENSVRDLFHLDSSTSFSSLLRPDPMQSGFLFDNNSLTMEVDDALWSGYQRAAADVATFVTGDATRLAKIAPPDSGNADARARAFVEQLGLRAHRHPLTAQEIDEYLALFHMGPSLYTEPGPFEAGAHAVIEAMLQSPKFLYRIETSSNVVSGVIPLDSYEMASRLSYSLWNTMPDDALFTAAAGDGLSDPDALLSQARRMIGDVRAEGMVADFHRQLFQVDRFSHISPAPAFFPNVPAALGTDAATEHQMFVREIVFAKQGGYADLLTSTDTFVNADLAKVYGLSGSFGSSFTKASLDPAQRRGIFTQIGFLAVNATSVNPDPIHRGVFIGRRITCAQISAPPANVPSLPEPQGRTNRKTVEEHTQMPGTICASCHATIINPLGFPFEGYDAIGAYRTMDSGQPVDASSDAPIGDQHVAVQNALELADALARSQAVHACYAKHWLEFAYGRPDADEDATVIDQVATRSLMDKLPVQELIVRLVTSPAFVSRSDRELP